jgi:23S rRNA (adenine2503-C2)-methyltransferase
MKITRIIKSIDGSVNYLIPYYKSMIECRYVRRASNYISVYVSSHNGCKMDCKFCWLTEQKQTNFKHVKNDIFEFQVEKVLENVPIKDNIIGNENIRCNINFMARGEPLANKNIVNDYSNVYEKINNVVKNYNYKETKMNISTIMPNTIKNHSLCNIFNNTPVNLYYSLYSVDDKFKNKWMSNAMNYNLALDKLKEYQNFTDNYSPLTIHGTFIKGENDNDDDIKRMFDEIEKRNLKKIKFNIVKFNPHKNSSYTESDPETLHNIYKKMQTITNYNNPNYNTTRQIERVGYDAFASCGMFVNDYDI